MLLVARRLHNLLAMTIAAVDYTKRTVRRYHRRRPALLVAHAARVAALHDSEHYSFVKFVRGYAIHVGRHEVIASLALSPNVAQTVTLAKRPLLQQLRGRRRPDELRAASWLKAAPDRIDLSDLVKTHLQAVHAFIAWYHSEQLLAFQEAREEIRPLLDEVERLRT